jgi:hypothetical protein
MKNKAIEKVTGYKGFDKNLRCREFQYEIGKSYEHGGDVSLCASGFHFCESPLDAFNYYPPGASRYAVVEAEDVSDKKEGDSKRVCRKLKIVREITLAELTEDAVSQIQEAWKKTDGKLKEIAASSGDYSTAASSGDSSTAASSGHSSTAASSGHSSTAASSGHSSTAASSGHSSTAASSGHSSKAASSGNSSKAASSGNYSKAASSGDYSKAASSGDYSTAASSGDSSKAASSGNYSTVAATGSATIAMAAGSGCEVSAGENGCFATAYWDEKSKRLRILVGYVGENGIEAETAYLIEDGKFVKV